MKGCSVYHQNQNREKAESKCSSLQQRFFFLPVYLYLIIELCLSLRKGRTCLRIAMQGYYFNVFGSILMSCFVYLFTYEKISMFRGHFLIWKKEKHFFLKALYQNGLNFLFLGNYHFMRLSHKCFSEKRYQFLAALKLYNFF